MEELAEINQKLQVIEENLLKNNKLKKMCIGVGLVSFLVACGGIGGIFLAGKVELLESTILAEVVSLGGFVAALRRVKIEAFFILHQQALRIDKVDLEAELEKEVKLPPFTLPAL